MAVGGVDVRGRPPFGIISKRTKIVGLMLLIAISEVFLIYLYLLPTSWPPTVIAVLGIFIGLAAFGLIGLQSRQGFLGLTGAYLLYLVLTHLGLPLSDLLGADLLRNYRPHQLEWYYSSSSTPSTILSALSIASFAVGASISAFSRRAPRVAILERKGDQGVYLVGMVLLLAAAAYLLGALLLGPLSITMSYLEYRSAIAALPGYEWFIFALAVGITFTLATGSPTQRTWALSVFVPIALVLLLTGNRGEVFYPALAAVGVMGTRGYRVDWRIIALGALSFFVVIPTIQHLRSVSLSEASLSRVVFSPFDPLTEMGFTLRTVVVTFDWIRNGEHYAYGQTYILPILRLIGRLIPFYERPEIVGTRFAVNDRTPRMGYSVVAESYFNFGWVGVIVVLGIIGFVLSWIGDRARTTRQLALSGAIAATLINNIRNSFIFVPGQITAACGLVLVALVVKSLLRDMSDGHDSSSQLTGRG